LKILYQSALAKEQIPNKWPSDSMIDGHHGNPNFGWQKRFPFWRDFLLLVIDLGEKLPNENYHFGRSIVFPKLFQMWYLFYIQSKWKGKNWVWKKSMHGVNGKHTFGRMITFLLIISWR
jgi:hypothetical protein